MKKTKIEEFASAISQELKAYASSTAGDVKAAVRKTASDVRKDIGAGAPRRTGKYAESWRTRTARETSQSLQMTVYSPKRYMLAHLLEHGHAKRGGGRVEGKEHIAPAEKRGIAELEKAIERSLRHG